jgi:hypothetical protein
MVEGICRTIGSPCRCPSSQRPITRRNTSVTRSVQSWSGRPANLAMLTLDAHEHDQVARHVGLLQFEACLAGGEDATGLCSARRSRSRRQAGASWAVARTTASRPKEQRRRYVRCPWWRALLGLVVVVARKLRR